MNLLKVFLFFLVLLIVNPSMAQTRPVLVNCKADIGSSRLILTIHPQENIVDCDEAYGDYCDSTRIDYNLIMDLENPASTMSRLSLDRLVDSTFIKETSFGVIISHEHFQISIPIGFRQTFTNRRGFRVAVESYLSTGDEQKTLSMFCR